MRVLQDLTQKPVRRQFGSRVVLTRDDLCPEPGKPMAEAPKGVVHRPWNGATLPRTPGCTALERERIEKAFSRSRRPSRQHLAPKLPPRMYRPQDQRGVQTVFVIMDRITGQVLARVRGSAAHCEIEAEKLARSQGGDLSDLKVIFEGELV